jgi:hypothetical protein
MIRQAMHDVSDLMAFIQQMKADLERGKFKDWQDFSQPIRQWFTSDRLQKIDATVMGWAEMSSYADQQTLIHLTAALLSLIGLPEYHALSPDDQNLALWIVLYHDVAKKAQQGKRDHTHGFRSAGICGKGLVHLGFVRDVDENALHDWVRLTETAKIFSEKHNDFIQDNNGLDGIMQGIDTIFGGRDSPVWLILCGVLFHMSLDVVDEFPSSAPLTNEQIRAYISPTLFPLLRVMMLTDNAAWAVFSPERRAPQHEQLYREFNRVEGLIS